MRYYDDSKSERKNHRIAVLVTIAIYFLVFTGIVFASQPELLPDFVKEWLEIESSEGQENIKQELPAEQSSKKDEKA